MVSKKQAAAAFIVAAEALGVDRDELGDLAACLASLSEDELAFFPKRDNKANIKFARSVGPKGAPAAPQNAATGGTSGDCTTGKTIKAHRMQQAAYQAIGELLQARHKSGGFCQATGYSGVCPCQHVQRHAQRHNHLLSATFSIADQHGYTF
ncbi:hypothetical protein Vretimale_7664 [Volvox reticuliferus]|uniref:Uncharacterized protein n=1 Tax=Volvox reticuliferus TaxID=1737510 RepID=A0A8J4LMZ1_9CHLO|nr:hypothetical protein Vretimale_7664 [Volvox reticuliferus]